MITLLDLAQTEDGIQANAQLIEAARLVSEAVTTLTGLVPAELGRTIRHNQSQGGKMEFALVLKQGQRTEIRLATTSRLGARTTLLNVKLSDEG